MNNNDFYDDIDFKEKKGFTVNKRIVIILIVVVLAIAAYFICRLLFTSHYDYSLQISSPDVVYVGEDSSINVNIVGDDKNSNNLLTSFLIYKDGVLSLSEYDIEGNSGSVNVLPEGVGYETIDIVTFMHHDNNTETGTKVAEKRVNITVCPAFDLKLLNDSNISVEKYDSYRLNIDFGGTSCSKNVKYFSSNNSIFMVDKYGVITGINSGKANLIISNGNKTITTSVLVK